MNSAQKWKQLCRSHIKTLALVVRWGAFSSPAVALLSLDRPPLLTTLVPLPHDWSVRIKFMIKSLRWNPLFETFVEQVLILNVRLIYQRGKIFSHYSHPLSVAVYKYVNTVEKHLQESKASDWLLSSSVRMDASAQATTSSALGPRPPAASPATRWCRCCRPVAAEWPCWSPGTPRLRSQWPRLLQHLLTPPPSPAHLNCRKLHPNIEPARWWVLEFSGYCDNFRKLSLCVFLAKPGRIRDPWSFSDQEGRPESGHLHHRLQPSDQLRLDCSVCAESGFGLICASFILVFRMKNLWVA